MSLRFDWENFDSLWLQSCRPAVIDDQSLPLRSNCPNPSCQYQSSGVSEGVVLASHSQRDRMVFCIGKCIVNKRLQTCRQSAYILQCNQQTVIDFFEEQSSTEVQQRLSVVSDADRCITSRCAGVYRAHTNNHARRIRGWRCQAKRVPLEVLPSMLWWSGCTWSSV